jgi:hypothetical protein
MPLTDEGVQLGGGVYRGRTGTLNERYNKSIIRTYKVRIFTHDELRIHTVIVVIQKSSESTIIRAAIRSNKSDTSFRRYGSDGE